MKLSLSILPVHILFFVFGLQVSGANTSPPDPVFNHITVIEGLPNNRVDCMLQDQDGYLWFGTKRGLCRYNGYEFKTYKSKINDSTSLRYHQISSLLESSDGTLWVGAWSGGLHQYSRKEDNFIRIDFGTRTDPSTNLIEHSAIHTIFEDSRGDIWVCQSDGLWIINRSAQDNIIQIAAPEAGSRLIEVRTICEDETGRIYFATGEKQSIFTYDRDLENTSRHKLHAATGILPGQINQIYPIDGKNLWVAADNGLFSINTKTWEIRLVESSNSPETGTSLLFIYPGKDGNLWMGGDGVYFYDKENEKFVHFTNDSKDPRTISGNIVTCGLRDNQDNLWFGTSSSGINVNYSTTRNFLRNPLLSESLEGISKNIPAIYESDDGLLLLGTWDKGLLIFDSRDRLLNNGHAFSELDHLNNSSIAEINTDGSGTIWIGSNGSTLTSFNMRTRQTGIYKIPHPYSEGHFVNKVMVDGLDRFWVGTSDGLFLFDSTRRSFTTQIENINVQHLEEDENGDIWVVSYDRRPFVILKDNSVSNFRSDDKRISIPENRYTTVFMDSRQRMWIGTEFNGLFLYLPDSNRFEQFTVENGLPSNDICSIEEDTKGRLWIGTNAGLSRFNYSLNDFKNYFRSEGMITDEFHYNSSFANKSGILYFGGTNGIVVFDPDDIRDNYLTFPVIIEEMAINNGTTKNDVNGIPFGEALRMNNPVRLRYNQNTISFKYANLNYADEKKSNFAYQLSGLHEDFQYVQDQRQVTFINLGPGEYTFNVIASNNDDIWDRKGAEFAFTILNPPWLTWWAYTIYGILLILIFYTLRSQVRHELKMKNAIRLERMEKDQQKELTQMKLRFFTNISHEFKTPLSLIIGPLDQIITELHGNSALKSKLFKISASSKRLLELINQLIDFRKIEQDALPLNKTSNDLVETIQKTMGAFDTLALNNEILFSLHTDFESLVINYDRDKIEKILSNILSNAYKFTSPGDKISLRIWQRNVDNVCITISDTGRGIAPEKLAGIFERFGTAFTTGSTTVDEQGSGIGLAYSKKLAELHNGSLQIESKHEQGTKVTLEFPCDREEIPLSGVEHKLRETIMDFSESPVNEPTMFETTSEDLGGLTGVPRILVVDDDTELRHYIVSILMDRFKIDEAGDGQSAYNLAMQNDYDLIVSDVMMPNMTGIELCSKLKSDINTSHIHVILLTVKSDMDSQIEGYETGADSYITKPFLPRQLIQVITNLLTTRRKIKAYYTSAEEKTEEPLGIHPRDKKLITDATAIIEKNISEEEFGVEVLGKELGLSRTHLFRKFKSLTGKAPNDFIRQIRLRKAARLLKEGNYSISEIAYMVGFKTPANFSTSFKALYWKSPKEYQENI